MSLNVTHVEGVATHDGPVATEAPPKVVIRSPQVTMRNTLSPTLPARKSLTSSVPAQITAARSVSTTVSPSQASVLHQQLSSVPPSMPPSVPPWLAYRHPSPVLVRRSITPPRVGHSYGSCELPASLKSAAVPVTAASSLRRELKDLSLHHGQRQQGALSFVDNEQNALPQVQIVKNALSGASESKVSDLCAKVACQQVEQDVCLQMLKSSLDALHQQVQVLIRSSGAPEQLQRARSLSPLHPEPKADQKPDGWVKSYIDEENRKLWERLEEQLAAELAEQKTRLKTWSADFCVCAVQDLFGSEVQRQAQDIKSLNQQVCDMNESITQSLESIKSLNNQVNDLNEVTTVSLASLHQLLTKSTQDVANRSAQLHNFQKQGFINELPGRLQTIVETTGENHETDCTEVQACVKNLYQDVIAVISEFADPADSAQSRLHDAYEHRSVAHGDGYANENATCV